MSDLLRAAAKSITARPLRRSGAPIVLACLAVLTLGSCASAGNGWFGWWSRDEETAPGTRQKQYGGKTWPRDARPCGPAEPLVHRYHTAHYWPDPYRWQDRGVVKNTLALQENNGWITATTLYEQHFYPDSNELNEAGKLHLQWILLHAPASRRVAWVQAGSTDQISQTRLASAQTEAQLLGVQQCGPIMLRVCLPYGRSANEVDLINRNALNTIPTPRLPIPVTGGAGGSGGSGGGGGNNNTSQFIGPEANLPSPNLTADELPVIRPNVRR